MLVAKGGSEMPDDKFAGWGLPQWSEEGVPEDNKAEPLDAEVDDGSEN